MTTPRLVTPRLCLVPLDTRELAARMTSADFTLALDGLGLIRFGPDHPGELAAIYPLLLAATPHPGQVLGTWTLIHLADREAVGSAGIKGQPDEDGAVEVGYGFIPSHRGQGLASEALRAVCGALLAGQVPLDRPVTSIAAETRGDNLASQHVLAACGFTHVGERQDDHDGPLLCWTLQG